MYRHKLGWQWYCAAAIGAQICQRAREAPRTRSRRLYSDHKRFLGGSPRVVVSKPAAKLKPKCQKVSTSQKQTSITEHTVFSHFRILHLLGGVILTTLRCRPWGPALGRFERRPRPCGRADAQREQVGNRVSRTLTGPYAAAGGGRRPQGACNDCGSQDRGFLPPEWHVGLPLGTRLAPRSLISLHS